MFSDAKNEFEARMSSSASDCIGGGGGFNMLNFMSMILLTAQVCTKNKHEQAIIVRGTATELSKFQ